LLPNKQVKRQRYISHLKIY